MKKRIIPILVGSLIFGLFQELSAQEQTGQTPENKWDDIGSNWYLEAGAGAQVLFSKDASSLNFGDRITPSFSLTGGKWFSEYWGLRLQLQGYSFNGYSTVNGIYLGNPLHGGLIYGPHDPVRNEVTIRPDGSYRHFLRYMNLHADFQFSLLNLLRHGETDCKWDVIPAVGLGYMHLFPYKGTPKNNALTANFSIMGKYRLTKDFDLNLEMQTAVMPDQFDGRIAGRLYENNCAVTLGVTYHFKKRGFKPRVQYIPQEVIRVINDTITVNKEIRVEVEKEVFNKPFTLASIRFNLNSYVPKRNQEMQYVNIVKYLEQNPRAKIRLDGYADPLGTAVYNLHLSMKRAVWVRDILMKEYGVDENRIQAQGIGVNGQPYKKRDWNRVVLVTVFEE
ncbi:MULTISPECIES: OmpA family protein [unclassified Bacteroides]|jgi:outer membrane protein OmpA-like peptidoglycan-associated protein|uniref:OmpA family protein n=1 Tax=unclassified Bacteroides TaxID=2646097 RepID=UPI000E8C0AE7|nr:MULTISPECIES: OmpA family protein [unclassified Bacteroides]RGN44764.1 OmpA family protein [Bacteroides sp. OM05-12]RHR72719.1 OmpA family protein [Bacteroides sp. AF16-49]